MSDDWTCSLISRLTSHRRDFGEDDKHLKKKVNKRKRRILEHLRRAADAIRWDCYAHLSMREWRRIGVPENANQEVLERAAKLCEEASILVKECHGHSDPKHNPVINL